MRRRRAAPLFATAKTLARVLFVGQGATAIGPLKCAATSRSPGSRQRNGEALLQLLFLFWRQQAITLRVTHRSVVSPLAAVPLAVLAAASSPGSLATFATIRLASSRVRLIARQGGATRTPKP